nr:GAF domain-containing protein [Anaerolineae bacterium]
MRKRWLTSKLVFTIGTLVATNVVFLSVVSVYSLRDPILIGVLYACAQSIIILVVVMQYFSVKQYIDRIVTTLQSRLSEPFLSDVCGKRTSSSPDPNNQIDLLIDRYHQQQEDMIRRSERIDSVNLIAATINRTLDLQVILDTSLSEILRIMNWDMGAIYIYDDRTQIMNMVSYQGLTEDAVRNSLTYRLGEGMAGRSAKSRQIMVTEDITNSPEYEPAACADLPRTQVTVPLTNVAGSLLGILQIGSSNLRSINEPELNLLSTVAHQVALAIDKAQLYQAANQHAQDLEKIVEARTAELAEAIDKLSVALEKAQEAEKVKSLLISTVSHELRTPLATIKGNTSLLIEHHDKLPSDVLVQHLADIEEETDKLTDLISNLLEMSRIEAGSLHIQREPINVIDVLDSTLGAARLRHPQATLNLITPRKLPMVYADPRRIEQIVANLVDNACKYAPPQEPVTIQAEAADDEIKVSVRDSGRGVAPEHQEKIFDRFYQVTDPASSGDTGRHGIGLGLAICRGLVEAHEGRIWVESEPGKGATFAFTLPVATRERLSSGGHNG